MKTLLSTLILLITAVQTQAFCGFYVAKAGSELFNNKSEIILVRDGQRTTITMSNDFNGNVKDFAMVVPVPNVLERNDIRMVNRNIFSTLDAYSAPRLVEYYDQNPCYSYKDKVVRTFDSSIPPPQILEVAEDTEEEDYGVTIEAQYDVDEYTILILSATESKGLKTWLVKNGYKVPGKAESVLEPYIKDNLKFFVVKVNLNKYNIQQNGGFLRPIQITVSSERFMLPIRLGMANSRGEQDMIVYAFTKTGRVESTNYRTVKAPTGNKIPTFVKDRFGDFYRDVFKVAHRRENSTALFLEYAWNVTPSWGGMKCDPCVGNPPYFTDLTVAGVSWANTTAPVFFTRLHVRYTQDQFPEDLFFQETPNKEHFQSRYVLTHSATGQTQCNEASEYWREVRHRRKDELLELATLTHWDPVQYTDYIFTGKTVSTKNEKYKTPSVGIAPGQRIPIAAFGFTVTLLMIYLGRALRKRLILSNI